MNDSKPSNTKERILDAAESLFAERGFASTSLRDITAAAEVNLAAVNYHFQSKDALVQAVFARTVGPVNQMRLAMLDEFEAKANGAAAPLEEVLRAFIEPVVRMCRQPQGASVACLIGRVFVEPGDLFEHLFRGQFAGVLARFMAALKRSLPGASDAELFWKFHFAIGAMGHTVAGLRHIRMTSGGQCDISDVDGIVERLISFVAAGFAAKTQAPARGGRR